MLGFFQSTFIAHLFFSPLLSFPLYSCVARLHGNERIQTSEGLLGFSAVPGASLHQLEPVALPNLSSHTLVQLATGDDHFLALTTDGHVFACGNGEQHQLGRKIIARVSRA